MSQSKMVQTLRESRRAVYDKLLALSDKVASEKRAFTDAEDSEWHDGNAHLDSYDARIKSVIDGEQRQQDIENAFNNLAGQPIDRNAPAGGADVRSGAGGNDGELEPRAQIEQFAKLLRTRTPGIVEMRALATANSGSRTDVWAANIGLAFVHSAVGIPDLDSGGELSWQAPKWAALTPVAATAEGAAFPILTDPTLATAVLARYGRYTLVSDEAMRFGTTLEDIGLRLADEVISDVNTAVVNALETAAVAQAFAVSAAQSLDTAVAKVRAATGAATGVLVNPADYFLFSQKTGADSGDDIGSPVVAWNGVPLVPHDAVDAGFATVVSGRAFKLIGTALSLESAPELATGQMGARARMHAVLGVGMGGNVAVRADIITP